LTKTHKSKYDTNFKIGGLFFKEFISLKDIVLSDRFGELMAEDIEKNNFMRISTRSARVRIGREIKRRVEIAPDGFFDNFYSWTTRQQKIGLFFLCLKAYPIVLDMHFDVAVPNFKKGAGLDSYSLTLFFETLSSQDKYVDEWAEQTKSDIASTYRGVLRELGLLDDSDNLTRTDESDPMFWEYFKLNGNAWLKEACFLSL
jgi:hypothetical protein